MFERPCLSRPCLSTLWQDHACQCHVFQDHVFSRPHLTRLCFSRLCQDHVCQDHVFQDHVCQDHVWQDHFCQDLVLDTMTWSILDQFNPFLSNLIQFEHVCSSLNQFNLWILWSHFDTFFWIKFMNYEQNQNIMIHCGSNNWTPCSFEFWIRRLDLLPDEFCGLILTHAILKDTRFWRRIWIWTL